MKTLVSGRTQTVTIDPEKPSVLIGERLNPSGKKWLAAALKQGDLSVVRREARAQVEAGAGIIDVNVGAPGIDEVAMLPAVAMAVLEEVEVPLCLDSKDPKALAAALAVCPGKPIVNSVTGEEQSLAEILPLVKEYGAAVIGLTMDDGGIPKDGAARAAIAAKIVSRAEALGIPPQDVIIDCLALALGADGNAANVTLDAVARVRAEQGVNQTLGISNVSFGLPRRGLINQLFLAAAIKNGVTCPTVDPGQVRQTVLAMDLILGRDRFARRFLEDYRAGLDRG